MEGVVLEKEQIWEELRNAREELLKKGQKDAEERTKLNLSEGLSLGYEEGKTHLTDPDKNKMYDKKKSKKSKKRKREKKLKKHIKKEKKKRRRKETSDETSDGEEDIKRKPKQSQYKSGSSLSSDEWVEKKVENVGITPTQPLVRDTWMTEGRFTLPTYCKNYEVQNEKQKTGFESYDPSKSCRELNPYWKDGGKGLPAFQKPKEDDEYKLSTERNNKTTLGNWRKKTIIKQKLENLQDKSAEALENFSYKESVSNSNVRRIEIQCLTDQQMNELGAKLIKAEIMGDKSTAEELRKKLEKARKAKALIKDDKNRELEEHILLTTTDNKGTIRPLLKRDSSFKDPYERGKGKSKRVETHVSGERIKYFPDDGRYDINQMFQREKYVTASDSDEQFVKIAGKYKNNNEDLDDIFTDKIRENMSEHKQEEKEKKRAINEYEQFSNVLDNCDMCLNSEKMEKQSIVSMGSTVYLGIPWHEGLQPGHCLITPIQHVSCSTQLDEDMWREITEYRKALTRMFASKSQEVVFFETARYLNKRPHMIIHCVPSSSKHFEMAPFYFKKAIQESEHMWSTNKQLISLNGRDVRRAIPKGLPYFWVQFGMGDGFAHVIEDQQKFRSNFAQEIIGGMLELDPRMWRKPRKEYNLTQKVEQFVEWWKPFDITS